MLLLAEHALVDGQVPQSCACLREGDAVPEGQIPQDYQHGTVRDVSEGGGWSDSHGARVVLESTKKSAGDSRMQGVRNPRSFTLD